MEPSPRTQRRAARSHDAIIAATVDLVARVGYSQLTIEGVAAAAGVGKATVYRWWPTKLMLVIDAIDVELTRARRVRLPVSGSSAAVVRELVRSVVSVLGSPVGQMLAAVMADLPGDPQARPALAEALGPHRAAGASVIYALAARGDLPHDVDAQRLLDMVAGTVLSGVLAGRPLSDDLVDQLVDLVLEARLPRVTY
jgi:AcrR family transcriptional regulator